MSEEDKVASWEPFPLAPHITPVRTMGFLSHRGPDVKKELVEPLHSLCDKLGCHFFFDRTDIQRMFTIDC
jgi:hypothetical protein